MSSLPLLLSLLTYVWQSTNTMMEKTVYEELPGTGRLRHTKANIVVSLEAVLKGAKGRLEEGLPGH